MKIVNYKHQINECGLQFLVEECHIDEKFLRDTFEVIPVSEDQDLSLFSRRHRNNLEGIPVSEDEI